MRVSRLIPIAAFLAVLGGHYAWVAHGQGSGLWASLEPAGPPSVFAAYVRGESVWLGLSYALAAAFASFGLVRLIRRQRGGAAGTVGGLSLVGALSVAGCFLLGCCGSPMLPVYLSVFGPQFLGIRGPLVLGLTALSVGVGYVCMTRVRRGACCGSSTVVEVEAACCESQAARARPQWIIGHVDTGLGPVPQVRTAWAAGDLRGAVKARLGVGRMDYRVEPGLYAVGEPAPESPVLVSANYKMSFDHLRRALGGRDAWILVLDTKGINVWCAAGKGTFGTDEIVRRVAAVRLPEVVSHRTLVVPQLGAPGVAARQVAAQAGFRVVYGPIRAADLPAFLDAGMKATRPMRQVTFTLGERAVLIPVELMHWGTRALLAAGALLLLGGLGTSGYSVSRAASVGGTAAGLLLAGLVSGAVIVPLLLPWLPGRAFSVKGAVVGLVCALVYGGVRLAAGTSMSVGTAAWLLLLPAMSAFFAMNFTGSTPYTSLSGVKREMRTAVPVQVATAVAGFGLWIVGLFV